MGIIIVKFSVDSKYVITVSADTNDEQSIDLWDWASGAEEPICMSINYNIFLLKKSMLKRTF